MYQQPAHHEPDEEELERAKKLQHRRQNPDVSTPAAEQAKLQAARNPPAILTAVKSVEETPRAEPARMAENPASGPQMVASERTKTKEVTRVDQFVSSVVNRETGHREVSVSKSELIYDEQEKAESSHMQMQTPKTEHIGIERGLVQDGEHSGAWCAKRT